MDFKTLISITSLITTVVVAIGSFCYIKFQTSQNKRDIEKLETELEHLRDRIDTSFSKIYIKIDKGGDRIIDKIDNIKKEFVSVVSCTRLQEACKHRNQE